MRKIALSIAVVAAAAAPGGAAAAPHEFTDWSSQSSLTTNGTLQGRNVVLTSPETVGGSVFNGTSTQFSDGSLYTPPIPYGDVVEIVGRNGNSFTLNLGGPTKDPVFHLYSLASTIAFPGGTTVTKVSGQSTFTVSGNTVSGTANGSGDSSGTIRLTGTFSSLTFTATPTFGDGSMADGISMQVGVRLAVPPPTTTITVNTTPQPGGYYNNFVLARVSATGDPAGDPRETRCVLDPPSPPASFDALPAGCPFAPSGPFPRFVSGVGDHTIYAASRNATGEAEALVSRTFRIEAPPETTITDAPQGSIWNPTPQFSFSGGTTYECRIGAPFAPCTSPFTAPVLTSTPHAFEARAINARGIPDPTPARADFAINQTDRKRFSCEASPISGIFIVGPKFPERTACMIGTLGPNGCREPAYCVIRDERCPQGARCTLTTTAALFDADLGVDWPAYALAAYGPITWSYYGLVLPNADSRRGSEQRCSTGFDGDRCRVEASFTWLGNDQPAFAACSLGWEPGIWRQTTFRDDTARRIECDAELKIEPARPYVAVLPIIIPGLLVTQVGVPGAGTISLAASILTSSASAVRRKKPKPKIASQTKKVAKAGPVTFRLRLNTAARALLKRNRKLRVRLASTFKPSGGGPTVKKSLVTSIKQPQPKPHRCRIRKASCRP